MTSRELFLWCVEKWPFDFYATIVLAVVAFLFGLWVFSRRRPERWTRFSRGFWLVVRKGAWGVGMTLLSPWLMLRALGFSKNGGDSYHFDPIKFFFNLACATGIMLLYGSGRTFEGVCVGPNVVDRRIVDSRGSVSRKRRRNRSYRGSARGERYRCWLEVKRLKTEPISFFSLMMILLFMGMYYYRFDLREGDRSNGLAQVIDAAGRIVALKYGGPSAVSTVTSSSSDSGSLGVSGSSLDVDDSGSLGRAVKAGKIVSIDDDPFLK